VKDEFRRFQSALTDCMTLSDQGAARPAVEIERMRGFLDPTVRRRFDQSAPRLADLDALQQIAAGYPSRSRLLAELALDPPNSTSDLAGDGSKDEGFLVLSTVHSAKGGEWRVVHLIHASDGLFPSDLATGKAETLEEERRLFYVAVTRAKDVLEITATQRYYFRPYGWDDAHGYGQLSRFLSASVLELLDHETSIPTTRFDDDPAPQVSSAEIDEPILSLLQ
jgi:DNA helicase-2/ATP-dependent DNA helicase PcrA